MALRQLDLWLPLCRSAVSRSRSPAQDFLKQQLRRRGRLQDLHEAEITSIRLHLPQSRREVTKGTFVPAVGDGRSWESCGDMATEACISRQFEVDRFRRGLYQVPMARTLWIRSFGCTGTCGSACKPPNFGLQLLHQFVERGWPSAMADIHIYFGRGLSRHSLPFLFQVACAAIAHTFFKTRARTASYKISTRI